MAQYLTDQNPIYAPAMRDILSISNSYPCSIVTTFDGINPGDHGYLSGLIVRINIPLGFGMRPFNTNTGYMITVTSPTSFIIPLDTTNLDAFVVPTGSDYITHMYQTPAQVVPMGEITSQLDQAVINQFQQ